MSNDAIDFFIIDANKIIDKAFSSAGNWEFIKISTVNICQWLFIFIYFYNKSNLMIKLNK